MNSDTHQNLLLQEIGSYGSCAVAFSAGVDSTVVAKAAQMALGDRAIAVTGTSASLADRELAHARELTKLIGIRHRELATEEFANPQYVQNDTNRCYFCKDELYKRLTGLTEQLGVAVICNGANLDDVGDYRPGMRAAAEQHVRSPLLDCRLGKAEVRALARHWDLPVWDKPASPCLSSRISYGQRVTPERLERVDRAESFLRKLGFREVRVRHHGDDLARVEVPPAEIQRACEPEVRLAVQRELTQLGFKFVTLDLTGFRSGSLNSVIPLESLGLSGGTQTDM